MDNIMTAPLISRATLAYILAHMRLTCVVQCLLLVSILGLILIQIKRLRADRTEGQLPSKRLRKHMRLARLTRGVSVVAFLLGFWPGFLQIFINLLPKGSATSITYVLIWRDWEPDTPTQMAMDFLGPIYVGLIALLVGVAQYTIIDFAARRWTPDAPTPETHQEQPPCSPATGRG